MNSIPTHPLPFERHPSPVPSEERATLLEDPGFGRVFTDHMVTIRYTPDRGWHGGKVTARAGFPGDPAIMVFHYASEIFEGLKAYRMHGGGGALFRPGANAARFYNSAVRMAMAPLPETLFVESVRSLARADRDWMPSKEGGSLYLRPFMIGSDVGLGAKPSTGFLYCVIASPVGSYFKGGSAAVSLWVSDNYTRAAPGGTGAAKCGGNYAAGFAAQIEAEGEGCEQVVFLDAVERKWVEELGGMNVFFVFDDGSLRTPPLTGTILPGVTRDSLLTLGRDMGFAVREEPYAMDQWEADARSGRLREAFACGTAAVVTPIGRVKGRRHAFAIGDGGTGEITARLKAALTDIQFGRAPDPHGWIDRLF